MDKKKKILVVDDEPDVRKMVEVRLKANEYDVVTAADGNEGLERVRADNPDLILLDMMMPGIDGFQFFKLMRRDPQTARIPIMMLTARGAMRDTFETLGADDFLSKPFESEELLLKISRIFKHSAMVLSTDERVIEKIGKVLREAQYDVGVAADEEKMAEMGREIKYKVIVVHQKCTKKEPAVFALGVRMMREKNAQVVLYMDTPLKSKDPEVAAEDAALKEAWVKAGVKIYDTRAPEKPLSEMIKIPVNQ